MLRMRRIVLTLAMLSLPASGLLLGGNEARADGHRGGYGGKYGGGYGGKFGGGYGGGYRGRVIDPGRPGGRVFVDPGRPGGRLFPGYDPGFPGGPVFFGTGHNFYNRGRYHQHHGRWCYDRHCHLYGGFRRY